MILNDLFTGFIFLSVLVIICYGVKVIFEIFRSKKIAFKTYSALCDYYSTENLIFLKNKEKLQLIDDFHKILFNRLFKITSDLLLVQKLIFETRIK